MSFIFMQMLNNKTVRGAPSTNCRCEEAETKATVTLMVSLVIKRPLMYVLSRLFYLLLPLCLLLSVSTRLNQFLY